MRDDPQINIIRSLRTSISIQIRSDGSLVVKAPVFMTIGSIHRFLEEKGVWIREQRDKLQRRPKPTKKQYADGEQFLYLGNMVTLKLGDYTEIHVKGDTLFFPKFLQFRIEIELKNWYIKRAREVITERVKINASAMEMTYKSISFSDTKSKWGSCTHDNHLQFCWRLIMAPLLVINYVVIHELVHTEIKNHSEHFWRKVRSYNPSYKQQIKWLKHQGELLVV